MLQMTDVIREKYSEVMPNLLVVLQSCLIIPMNTAKREHGFSTPIESKLNSGLV